MRRLSGATPLTSLATLPEDWEAVCGCIGPIEVRAIQGRDYAFVHAPRGCTGPRATRVRTLLVGAPDEHALAELKCCIPQAIRAIVEVSFGGSAHALEGAGLTEVFLGDALASRARRELPRAEDAGVRCAVLAVAGCLWDAAAALHADSKESERLARDGCLLGARGALEDMRRSGARLADGVLEAETCKKSSLLGSLDLAGVLIRIGGVVGAREHFRGTA